MTRQDAGAQRPKWALSLQPERLANKADTLELCSQGLPELSQEGLGGSGGAGESNCYSVFFNEMYCPLLKEYGSVFCHDN